MVSHLNLCLTTLRIHFHCMHIDTLSVSILLSPVPLNLVSRPYTTFISRLFFRIFTAAAYTHCAVRDTGDWNQTEMCIASESMDRND